MVCSVGVVRRSAYHADPCPSRGAEHFSISHGPILAGSGDGALRDIRRKCACRLISRGGDLLALRAGVCRSRNGQSGIGARLHHADRRTRDRPFTGSDFRGFLAGVASSRGSGFSRPMGPDVLGDDDRGGWSGPGAHRGDAPASLARGPAGVPGRTDWLGLQSPADQARFSGATVMICPLRSLTAGNGVRSMVWLDSPIP